MGGILWMILAQASACALDAEAQEDACASGQNAEMQHANDANGTDFMDVLAQASACALDEDAQADACASG